MFCALVLRGDSWNEAPVQAPVTRLGRALDAWVVFMLRHRVAVLAFVFLSTAALGVVITQLPIITALRDYIPKHVKGMDVYDEARARFGGDEVMLIGLEAEDHLTPAGLARIDALTRALEAEPLVDRALSLSNVDRIAAEGEELSIAPYSEAGLSPEALAAALDADPLFAGRLLSKDRRLAMVVATLVSTEEPSLRDSAVRARVDAHAATLPGIELQRRLPGSELRFLDLAKQAWSRGARERVVAFGFSPERVHVAGFPAATAFMVGEAEHNMARLLPLTLILILLLLFVIHRDPLDSLVPLFAVGPAVVWSVALGGLAFERLTVITSLAPMMVLIVGVSDVVHLVTQFRHELALGASREEAIRLAFRRVGFACALTSLTTFVGFGSMLMLPVPMSRELGLFCGFGVVSAFILSFVLTPIALSIAKPHGRADVAGGLGARFLERLAEVVIRRARPIVAVGLAGTLIAIALATTVRIENQFGLKFPEGHAYRASVRAIDDHIGGINFLELLVDTGEPDGALDPGLYAALHRYRQRILALPDVAEVRSYADIVERLHAVMGGAGAVDTRAALAQYLLLFDMSEGEGLDSLLDAERRHLRITVGVKEMSAEELIALADRLEAMAAEILPVPAATNGTGLLASRTAPELKSAAFNGLGTAVLIIAGLLGLAFRSAKVGAASLIPNVLPVALATAIVSATYGSVDGDMLSFLALSLGIAVDDTIHVVARFNMERAHGVSREVAAATAIRESGHGVLRTSIVLGVGFAVLVLSSYVPIAQVGVLFPLSFLFAVVLDLTMVPAMAVLGWLDARPAS